MDTERTIMAFKENLEKLSKGKLQDYEEWYLHFSNLPTAASSIVGEICSSIDSIKDDIEKHKGEDWTKNGLKIRIGNHLNSILEETFQVNSILWFISKGLSMDDFLDLGNLIFEYKQLKKEGNAVLKF